MERGECVMATRRVLLIDDQEDIRAVAQMSLEVVAGWQVVTASSGDEGIRRAEQEQPEAILLDVMMPDMDGPTTFGHLQRNPLTAHIPVIFLTAKVQGAERRQLANLGVAAVIAKPFDPVTLGDEIGRSLGWNP